MPPFGVRSVVTITLDAMGAVQVWLNGAEREDALKMVEAVRDHLAGEQRTATVDQIMASIANGGRN